MENLKKKKLKKVRKISLLNAVMQGDKKAEIRIYGIIGEGWGADVTSEDINRELDALGDVTEISVRINSPGGGVFAGCAIYNSLKRHKAKIIVYIDGVCASIATVPVMAGDVIIMSRAAMMMIHNPYFPRTSGGAKELRKKADDLDKFKEVSIGAYLTKVNLTREELIEKMDYETWMNADEAKEYGFITEIENDSQANMMAVSNNMLMCGKNLQLDISKYKNLNSFLKKEHLLKAKPVNQNINIDNLNKKGDEKMDLNQLMQQHPDLYKQIVQVGVTKERSRIQNLETIEQRAGRSLDCIQKAKFETPLEATNQELMTDILQEMATQPKNSEKQAKPENKMDILLNKIDDAKAGGVQEQILDGMTQEEIKAKQEKDEIDDIVALANGEE